MLHPVYIGLGSNLQDPASQIEQAFQAIDQLPQTRLLKHSRLYSSKPLGPQDQPDFVNAVCLVETELEAQALLTALQEIERNQGRIKKRHWGERNIDLDILLYADQKLKTQTLTIPHPEIAQRDFVLLPLAEITPGLLIPELGRVEDLISQLETTFVIPLAL
ncbi:MAG: 2-amino-4-hydroxy-6-hydroxymethyldihydropteridine diphosphokinase [Thiomicrorhabdus chilensis]|uniref:2-amino-4-hydroxy-6- hydroxymethyldihydropteridine diphosphokinase n=1 Tax=Thiomicrorhabdus chilensis TaxID=63656 RepID=UPI00299E505B|nr:2-amino-4-hydroxy-6-hydroxymethyldihydropteridine diphosphokinase [Thiomicrorhabdus chilensis]MDX1348372.1 2-amino-4-hydroxy-6-hydroxymethyldihydropteridine diphosphokinase [Thiomicrorhabdus chilensis]